VQSSEPFIARLNDTSNGSSPRTLPASAIDASCPSPASRIAGASIANPRKRGLSLFLAARLGLMWGGMIGYNNDDPTLYRLDRDNPRGVVQTLAHTKAAVALPPS
jgi:hypothetical protein